MNHEALFAISLRFRFLLSQHCNLLEELTLDHSSVTDRGIRFLSGWSGGVRRSLFSDGPALPYAPVSADLLQVENLPGIELICPQALVFRTSLADAIEDGAIDFLPGDPGSNP